MAVSKRLKWKLALIVLAGAMVAGFWPNGVVRAEMQAIKLYQTVGSPVTRLVVRCHYDPSCSHYALQVLQKHGLWTGNLKVVQRLALCSPLGLLLDYLNETDS